MRPRTLLALTIAVLALGAFIFFYEKDLPSTDERAELAKKVLRLDAAAVESVLIEWDGQAVRLERIEPPSTRRVANVTRPGGEGGVETVSSGIAAAGWRITSPLAARADRSAVDSLVSSLTGLESSRTLEDFDRGELGLGQPRARVTLAAADSQSVLEIGTELPASSDMVVALAGGRVAYQVSASIFDDLTKAPGDWRDKKLFLGGRGDVERVTLTRGDERVLIAKRGDDFWIESPLVDRADEALVNKLMSQLTGLAVESFLDQTPLTPEGMGLDPAQGTVEVVLAGDGQPFRLELGHPVDESNGLVYGQADGQQFELEAELSGSIAVSAADWRSKSLTTLQVFEIESARFEDAGGTVEMSRDGADWKRGDERIAYSAVSDLLYPITETKGEQIVERDAAVARGHGLETPELSISFTTKDGAEELALFGAVEGLAAATIDGREVVLLVAEDQVSEIRDKLQELRAAEPLPEDGGDEPGEEDIKEGGPGEP